ncbi:MAG: tetratricopeptide repeat protein [Thermodesulfobacteriota bacterium]|nr:tetratricopeptide repeat protein [Thermodesulfobacteriota bacterium]
MRTVLLPATIVLIMMCIPGLSVAYSLDELKGLEEQAKKLYDEGRYAEAIPIAERVLEISERHLQNDPASMVSALTSLGNLHIGLGQYKKAEPYASRALAIADTALPSDSNQVDVMVKEVLLGILGSICIELGDHSRAVELLDRRLKMLESSSSSDLLYSGPIAETLGGIGRVYWSQNEYDKALPVFERQLELCAKKYEEAISWLNAAGSRAPMDVRKDNLNYWAAAYGTAQACQGAVYIGLGDYERAENLTQRGLDTVKRHLPPDDPSIAYVLNNLALIYKDIGKYKESQALFEQALAIWRLAFPAEHPLLALVLNNIGSVHHALGDYDKAVALYEDSLRIRVHTLGPSHPDVAIVYNNLGNLYTDLGDYGRAEESLRRSLSILQAKYSTDNLDIARSMYNLGSVYVYTGQYEMAQPLLEKALDVRLKKLPSDHSEIENSLLALGTLYLKSDAIDDALKLFKSHGGSSGLGACYIAKGEYDRAIAELLTKLFLWSLTSASREDSKRRRDFVISDDIGLGISFEGMGDLAMAEDHFGEAIDLIELEWMSLGLSQRRNFLSGRVGFFTRMDAYEGMVRVILKARGTMYEDEALHYAERVKSRTLLEMLAARSPEARGKEDSTILSKDHQFQRDIVIQNKKLSKLIELGAKAPTGERERVELKLNQTVQDYERFINEVKLENKELASLVTVQATPVEEIQALLDPSVTILEYFTTKDKTYVWLITRDDIAVHELDLGEKYLVAQVNDFLLPNMSKRPRRPEPVISLSTGGSQAEEQGERKREKNRQRFLETAREFHSALVRPIENGIRTKDLIIVPHGVLHKVPFAALTDGKEFMIEKYALSVVPSTSVIEYVVKKRNKDGGKLLAFANPETEYVPLPYSEAEVQNISGLFSEKGIYAKNEATETRVKKLSKLADIMHFSCHGKFNDKQPMQSGLLLAKDESNDGCLQVHEIFGLDLKNANLVTLSACVTGLSKIYGGDDLVGLARGFIYAGTPSLLATLWAVDDKSTSILIENFYANWKRKGMSKPKALKEAQMSLKATRDYSHPYYWAPFVLIGDWT